MRVSRFPSSWRRVWPVPRRYPPGCGAATRSSWVGRPAQARGTLVSIRRWRALGVRQARRGWFCRPDRSAHHRLCHGAGRRSAPTILPRMQVRTDRAARRALGPLTVAYPAGGTGAGGFRRRAPEPRRRQCRQRHRLYALAAVRQGADQFQPRQHSRRFQLHRLAVLDNQGGAVSCAVTLGSPFGAGRTVTDSGVQLAAAPSRSVGLASAFLMPVVAAGGDGYLPGRFGRRSQWRRSAFGGAGTDGGRRPPSLPADMQTTGAAPKDTVNVIACQDLCRAARSGRSFWARLCRRPAGLVAMKCMAPAIRGAVRL